MNEFKAGDLVRSINLNLYTVVSHTGSDVLVKNQKGVHFIFNVSEVGHFKPKNQEHNHSSDLKDRDLKDLAHMIQQFFNSGSAEEVFMLTEKIQVFIQPILDDDIK